MRMKTFKGDMKGSVFTQRVVNTWKALLERVVEGREQHLSVWMNICSPRQIGLLAKCWVMDYVVQFYASMFPWRLKVKGEPCQSVVCIQPMPG